LCEIITAPTRPVSLHFYGRNNIKIHRVQPGVFEVALPEALSKSPSDRPDKQNREVSIDLHIGAEASLIGVSHPIDAHYRIAVSCLAIDRFSSQGL
jgi:hypothetical protein